MSAADLFRNAAGDGREAPPQGAPICADHRGIATTGAAQPVPMSGPDGCGGGVAEGAQAPDPHGRDGVDAGTLPSQSQDAVGPHDSALPPPLLPCAPATVRGVDVTVLAAGDLVAWEYRGDVQVGLVAGVSLRAGLVHVTPIRSGGRIRLAKPAAELTTVLGVDQIEAHARQVAR